MNQKGSFHAYAPCPDRDYFNCTEKDISEITSSGILLRDGTLIGFQVCADNFKKEHPNVSGRCVGERFAPVFVFYTPEKPTKLTFLRKNKLVEFFSPTRKRVLALQNSITRFGFTTCDMT